MKPNKCLIIFFLIVLVNIVFAQPIDFQTAEKTAIHFYLRQYNYFEGEIHPEEIQIKESFTLKEKGEDVLFIFNISPGGFVIIPSEKAIEPVLGYAFKGIYNPGKTPVNFSNWIQTYKNKVNYLKQNQSKAKKILNSKWDDLVHSEYSINSNIEGTKDIDPLVTANWEQGFPYNIFCPEDPTTGEYCPVGPVGVAMGQIMYYWRYPLIGTGSFTYYNYPYGTITVNFGETNYEWEGMMDVIDYNNPDPTALLLFHCAVSVATNFSPTGSGAYSSDVDNALVDFFGYDPSCVYLQRSSYQLSVWKQMLKDDFDNLQPVYYTGQSTEGGHAFVVDGYQESGDDYFHINFGWSGYMNGWYLITDAGGFTSQQAMVRNIFPGSGYPYYCQNLDTITSFSGTIDDGSGNTLNYQDNTDCNWLLKPQGDNDSISGLTINFSDFHTETVNDLVSIYDGPANNYPLLGSFSGSTLPPQIISSGNEVLISFSTNGTVTESGWLLNYESVYPVFCNQMQTYTAPTDTISDGSGQFYYQNSTNCMWMLEPLGAVELTIYFTSFETEENNDIVKLYDASNNQLLAEYSGYYTTGNLPPPVTSPSGEMFIIFQTNILNNGPGWEGIYESGTWLPPPAGITILDSIYSLNIFWNMPDYSSTVYSFLGFNIYRNGNQLNTGLFPDTTFVDAAGPGEWEYCVTAVYEEGESNPVCANIIIPCYGTLELNVNDEISGQGIEGISVTIGDTSIITGLNGLAMMMLPEGLHDISINATGYDLLISTVNILCDETTYLDLALIPLLPPPSNFEAEIFDETTVYCTWDPVDTTGFFYNLLGYNIYRNDTLLNTNILVGTFYYDFTFYLGNHEYCVTSVYDLSESEKTCEDIYLETGNLDGFVQNINTNIPVSGAIVSLYDYSDTTNSSGYFYISNIQTGSYEIEVTAENYNPLPPGMNIEIIEGSTTTANIPLSPLYLNPPVNLQFQVLNSGEGVKLFWSSPLPHPWILDGYNIFRRPEGIGEFELINEELVTDTFYVDAESPIASHTEFFVSAYYNAGESLSSNIILVIIPGIIQFSESYIQIVPNPAQEIIYIILPKSIGQNQCMLNLYNSMGKNSLTKIVKPDGNDPITLDLQNLEKGVYILNIHSNDINFTEKIILQ
ncbi:MAG: C10 family peptidase [Bacteroidales bacterium]|nr:C10 family peptidase [Bacteroidales bacterium]